MSIPVSTVPAAMNYLVASVQALANTDPLVAAGTAEILVKLGEEVQNRPPDVIEFGSVSRRVNWETMVGSGGALALYEQYDIECEVSSWLPYSDAFDETTAALQVNNRAWVLASYLETTIRTDPSLGGIAEIAYPQSSNATKPEPDSLQSGLIVTISLPIHVESFI